MFGQIFGAIGGFLGKEFFGGGILSSVARFAGKTLGDYFDREDYEPDEHYNFKNVRDSFNIAVASYGEAIPLVFGSVKVYGKIIWADNIKKCSIESTDKSYFSNTGTTKSIYHNTVYEYYISFAVSICEGEIADVSRVWSQGELIDLNNFTYRLYKGSGTQPVDPLISSCLSGQTPAYRDLAYIVFENVNLADFDNKIPVFAFEVIRKANIKIDSSLEDRINSMSIIPGSGEYVYDTVIQHKIIKSAGNVTISKQLINSHNYRNIANAVYSLNQLTVICPNLKWVSPVVCWFGNSLDAASCRIRPAVEYKGGNIEYSESWRVANYTRATAPQISRDVNNNPKYGGSVNDASVLRYLKELKSRNLKIMFYPMVFMDVDKKPWRGHLSGDASVIRDFFRKGEGYNEFILHYAELSKDLIDAFVIGSELIGLTKVRNSKGEYPAVDELVNLAKAVKNIVGKNVLVTYAADWSEYHHTQGGFYNLDPLWSSPYIDFIGIDAYFPLTRSTSGNISEEEITKGFYSGEGYDYYFDDNQNKQPLEPEYAWKNIKYWWENYHINPDNQTTAWIPKSKKIWFTEFGFPSIDKASNRPNVFYDPNCIDGGIPTFSNGEIDISLQRKCIKAFLNYQSKMPYIGEMFLWTWDARPYPAWPHMSIWRDGNLWEKGHWVNNKFGASTVSSIILELSNKCSIDLNKINVSSLDENVEGFVLNSVTSAKKALELLRISYFFDIKTACSNKINFIKRGSVIAQNLNSKDLIKISENSYLLEEEIASSNIISRLSIYFINNASDYKYSYLYYTNEKFSAKSIIFLKLPICISAQEAEALARSILNNAKIESGIIKFIVPITNFECEPGNIIQISYLNNNYQIRVISFELKGLLKFITGIVDSYEAYYLPRVKTNLNLIESSFVEPSYKILDLPINFGSDKPHFLAYLSGDKPYDLYAKAPGNDKDKKYLKIQTLKPQGIIGFVQELSVTEHANVYLIDEANKFQINCKNFKVDHEWNLCLIGSELIKFKHYKKIEDGIHEISHLIRGYSGTENAMRSHKSGEQFILLESASNIIEVSGKLEGELVSFKLNNSLDNYDICFQNKAQKLPAPYVRTFSNLKSSAEITLQQKTPYDDWKAPSATAKYDYIIQAGNKTLLKTKEDKININFAHFSLSAPFIFAILVQDELGNHSQALKIKIK